MTLEPPLPQDVWDALPDSARALFQAMRLQIESLQAEVAALKARLDANSQNSSKPPSTDPPHIKRQPPRPTAKRKRGGQPGHKRAIRPMVAPDQLAAVVECVPTACRSCGETLADTDPTPHPHQVAELPEVRPDVVEYRLHRLTCPHCRTVTRGALPPGVPAGAFGPRLLATVALLTGAYRLSKRQVRAIFGDLLGLSISTGMVSKAEHIAAEAVAEPVAGVAEAIARSPAAGVDETGWTQGRRRAWLWTAVAGGMTLFRIDRSRGAEALRRLVGEPIAPVITSDRFSTDKVVPRRQVCWAHLRRDFQAMIDRRSGGQEVGSKLLHFSGLIFRWWRRLQAGAIRHSTLRASVGWLRPVIRLNLESGRDGPCQWTAKVCRQLLALEASLWTFARVEGVAPDNNAAERALRHGVIWRKTSGGTDSERGGRFVGRILNVVATCRQQGRNILGFLVACLTARFEGTSAPSLRARDLVGSRSDGGQSVPVCGGLSPVP